MADDIWEIDEVLPKMAPECPWVWVKIVVTTGQPKCLILLEREGNHCKLPVLRLGKENLKDVPVQYAVHNFGYGEAWCDFRLLGIEDVDDDLIDGWRGLFVYYGITIAEETKIKNGEWVDLGQAMQIFKDNPDGKYIRKSLNQWLY